MSNRSAEQPRRGDDESMDAAARKLQEEMEEAVRHLREQVTRWSVTGGLELGGEDREVSGQAGGQVGAGRSGGAQVGAGRSGDDVGGGHSRRQAAGQRRRRAS